VVVPLQIISEFNSKKIMKIGPHLPKLSYMDYFVETRWSGARQRELCVLVIV